ncbi:hypothetical protein BHU61_09520 [Macrococcus epidermidis]|uniref:Uncharacterized protein n=1 Tax=Macrococcus epidermidis TaxID=1902580 RepID=A0A327ZPY5_9STAP|nr:hypothetical protein [Macrococcus epidermidis]RAK44383.1 hypothetical protein BHU61_09520 [Macrococcus epidermidis]
MLYRSKKQFIKETALDIIENLSEEQKNSLISNPNPSHYHFTLGIYIRNKYIYKNQLKFHYNHADHLSYEIIDSVLARIVPKYKKGQHRSFLKMI